MSRSIASILAVISLFNEITNAYNSTKDESCAGPTKSQESSSTNVLTVPTNNQYATPTYGVDISWPMHTASVSENYPGQSPSSTSQHQPKQYLGNRQNVYNHYMEGCRKRYPGSYCDDSEETRIEMSLRQPQSMVNYTSMGFRKIKAPPMVFELLQEFWKNNEGDMVEERWTHGNSYVNHWENPSYMASVEDDRFVGGGFALKNLIWASTEEIIREWTGQDVRTSSLYGIRVYKEGAILAPHVDRLPLVSSAIINVAQDVDEPWPLEVIGHDGRAHNVTMEPGDMILYESHSVLHGRPFALKGKYFANIFIHFAPVDTNGETPYIIPDSPEDIDRKKSGSRIEHPEYHTDGSNPAHLAARQGDLKSLTIIAKHHRNWIFQKDINGWTPYFEAVRGGYLEILKFLVAQGQDLYQESFGGEDGVYFSQVFEKRACEKYMKGLIYEDYFGTFPKFTLR